jgi:hypothetical protein
MDDIKRDARRFLDGAQYHGEAPQISDTAPSSPLEAQPRNVDTEILLLPFSFRNATQDSLSTRSALFQSLGTESERELQRLTTSMYPSYLPAASSVANGMLTLEQQLALMNEERQRSRASLPATSSLSDRMLPTEQQLSAYLGERQLRIPSMSAASCLPGRALNIDRQQQLAFLLEQQQQGRHQPFQAPNNAPDRVPTIEQLLASINDGRGSLQGSLQATSSVQNSTSCFDEHLASLINEQQGRIGQFQDRRMPSIDQQLASLNDEHQRRYGSFQARSSLPNRASTLDEHLASLIEEQQGRGSYFQDMRMPIMEQQLASLIGATSTSSPSYFQSNFMAEHPNSQLLSLEDQQLLAQLQRNPAPQAQLESQARGYPLEPAEQVPAEQDIQLPAAVRTEDPISIPPAYGRNGQIEAFPEKLYRLLAEAEMDGNVKIISFTPDGRAFKIHNRQAFIEEVSPKYFRHAKITSFVRQLNFYGFQKLLDGPNRGGFTNPPFLRGHPELLVMVKRKEVAPRPKRSPCQND